MAVKKNFLDRFIERVEDVDVNSRQAYILRLARERGFFETIFNAVEEGILVVDSGLRIRYFNNAAKEILGLPEDLKKIRLPQLLRGIDWRKILDQDADEWVRISRQELEIAYPRHRFISFYLVPHQEDPGMATVILHDVTESRSRTLEEVESQTAQAVSMLAAGVAHEIGNPLNSLYLNLQILERYCAPDSEPVPPEDAAEMIRDCKAEVERLDNIITGFLAAIRPGNPQLTPLDLKELVTDTVTFMRPELESRSVGVRFNWPEAIPPVCGDGKQLKQAFFNIIKNALQAMPVGGELRISASVSPEAITLEICDTGNGITAGQMATLFAPFKTNKPDGNGLGMMIIERILREHGAEFAVNSTPHEGTSVEIRFPRCERRMQMLPEDAGSEDEPPGL